MCIISKDIGINKEKEIYLPNKEFVIGHRCDRTYMATKCEIFMTCSKILIGILKKWISDKEYLQDYRYYRTNMD